MNVFICKFNYKMDCIKSSLLMEWLFQRFCSSGGYLYLTSQTPQKCIAIQVWWNSVQFFLNIRWNGIFWYVWMCCFSLSDQSLKPISIFAASVNGYIFPDVRFTLETNAKPMLSTYLKFRVTTLWSSSSSDATFALILCWINPFISHQQ